MTANNGDNSVSVLLGNGSGGFAREDRLRDRQLSVSVAVGDFNGDGKQDLATANIDGDSVSVLLTAERAAGAASPPKTDYATGCVPHSVAAGDFNGDGKQTWRRPTPAATASASCSATAAAASRPRPTTRPAPTRTRSPSPTSTATASRTWRRPTTKTTASASCWGTAAAASPPRPTTRPAPPALGRRRRLQRRRQAGPRDGQLRRQQRQRPAGDGSGGFAAKTDYATGATRARSPPATSTATASRTWPRPTTSTAPSASCWGTAAAASQPRPTTRPAPSPSRSPPATSTATASRTWRRPTTNDNSVSVLLGDGSGGFAAKTDYATGCGPVSVAVGDFNGDGKQDLVTADHTLAHRQRPAGGRQRQFGASDWYGVGEQPYSVAVADFNGDGKQDFVTRQRRAPHRQRAAQHDLPVRRAQGRARTG